MKLVDQESLHAKDAPRSDSNTSPMPSAMPAHQIRQGAFLSRAWAFLLHVLHSVVHIIHRKRVPELRQMSRVECGFACLAMILSYYGRKTPVSELRRRYRVGRDGLSALGLVRAARDYGMRVRAISLQQNDFRFVKLPAIVHWEFKHFLVVERWSRKRVVVVDPARGRYRLTPDEFDAGFTGVVITFEPGVAFDRRAAPPPRAFRTYVLQYIRQAPATILQLLGASLLLQVLGLTLPLVTKVVVDQVLPYRMSNVMAVLGIGILVLLLSQTVATLMRGWLLVYLQTRIDMHMMLGFVEHLLGLPYSFFQQRSTGDLLTRIASNIMLRDILSNQLLSTLLDSSLVIFYLLILLWQSLPFGVLTLVIGLLLELLLLGSTRPIRNLASRQLAAQGKSQGCLAEVLAGIATLKGSGAEQRAFERWANLYFDQLNISLRYNYLSSTVTTVMTALRLLAPLALLWVGAIQVLNGSMTLGTMVALTALAGAFFTPLASLVTSGQQFQLVGAHLERIADVTGAEPEQQGQAAQQPPPLTGHIRLEHVSFRYAPDAPEVLHRLDLTVEAGQKVAMVGPSGSGKSTLGKLLLGLYAPTEGSILYDGIPLRQLNYQEVRRQFGVVLQEATLFSGSILSNITLNNPTIDKEQVIEAAEIADIHEDIMGMPMGYETFVAEGGSALSGGQRQRLAIARAVAHKPGLLLLDEATSHLDVATEQRVAEHLQTLACTQIIIAHRLSTIRDADVILVLDQGTIVEKGSHDELLQRNGYYAGLMHQQLEHGVVAPDKEKADVDTNSVYMSEARDRATPALASRSERRIHATNGQTDFSKSEFAIPPGSEPPEASSPPNLAEIRCPNCQASLPGIAKYCTKCGLPLPSLEQFSDNKNPGNSIEGASQANSTLNPPSTTPVSPPPVPASSPRPASTRRNGGPFMTKQRMAFLFILLIVFVATTLGTFFALARGNAKTAASVNPVVGHVYFLSSEQLYVNNNQGINDEVLIDLHNIAVPAPGKSYYAWLLGDRNLSEAPWILLGEVSINRGNIHFLYAGDETHTNLLNDMSRFVITEEDANTTPDNPLLDPGTWRYYGEIYQIPSPTDPNHFSLLDHLRHLLVQAPELAPLGLQGGLSIWLTRNVEEISKWALSAKEHWGTKSVASIRQQLVNILYYLDGECTTQADLQGLPRSTPMLPETATIAHIAHFALLNPCVQEEQEQAQILKQVFQHTPHNFVDHLLFHMTGVIQSPGATPGQHALALQIDTAINNVKGWLIQVRQDAEQLLHMTNTQLTQLSALGILGDLETQARYAYAGRTDPASGEVQEGATWIYDNVERLATFDVTPYVSR